MAPAKKCTYYGIRLASGKLYVYAEWDRSWAKPIAIKSPGRYSKQWNWGEQAGKESYDLGYALILHTFRGYPGKEEVANRYAIPFAEEVLSALSTDVDPIKVPPSASGAPVLWTLTQDEVMNWVKDYEAELRRQYEMDRLLKEVIRNYK